jgi:hypothetical protein
LEESRGEDVMDLDADWRLAVKRDGFHWSDLVGAIVGVFDRGN